MIDAPTDKKLSERFAEAWNRDCDSFPGFMRMHFVEVLARLRLSESHPSATREAVEGEREQFAWLIEAPGPSYLAAHEGVGHIHEFRWTREPNEALRFYSQQQADAAMMAVRQLDPRLWGFAAVLGEARPVEHVWIAAAIREAVEGERERCTICDDIVLIDDERIRQEENHVYGTPGGLEHMGDVWRQISEWAAAIRARGEEKGNG